MLKHVADRTYKCVMMKSQKTSCVFSEEHYQVPRCKLLQITTIVLLKSYSRKIIRIIESPRKRVPLHNRHSQLVSKADMIKVSNSKLHCTATSLSHIPTSDRHSIQNKLQHLFQYHSRGPLYTTPRTKQITNQSEHQY